jgi:hypothetical protein
MRKRKNQVLPLPDPGAGGDFVASRPQQAADEQKTPLIRLQGDDVTDSRDTLAGVEEPSESARSSGQASDVGELADLIDDDELEDVNLRGSKGSIYSID